MNAHACRLLVALLLTGAGSLLAQPGAGGPNAVRDRVDAQLIRADSLTASRPDQALAVAQSALALAKQHGLAHQQGNAYRLLARLYAERGEYVLALDAAKTGLSVFDKLGERRDVCRMYVAMGIINRYLKLYDASIEANHQARKIAEELRDTVRLGAIYGNLGNVYFDKNDNDRALQFHQKALAIQTARGDEQAIGNTLHNLGLIHRVRKEYGKALEFHNQSLAIDLKHDNQRNLSISHFDLSLLFQDMGDFRKALQHAQQALAVAERIGSKRLEQQALSNLSLFYGILGKPNEALRANQRYHHLTDSLQSAELSNRIADLQARYQGEQKDRELSLQNLRLAAQQASLGQQRLLIAGLVAFLLLGGLLGYLLFNRYKLRQRNLKLSLENEQYRLAQNLQLRRDIDDTIQYFAASLYGKNTVNEILWDVAKNCIARLGFVDCVVYLLDESQNALLQKAAYGNKNPEDYAILNPIVIPVGQGIVGSVAQSGQPELVADTTQDPRYLLDDEVRYSELAVPLLFQNRVIGVIDSEHPERGFFTDHHREALQTIAAICSSKIAQAWAEEEARKARLAQLEADYIKRMDRVKSQFFANVSHEFRTPLHLILAPLRKRDEVISRSEKDMMGRNAERLLRLVNQLLDLAKAEMGMLKLWLEPGDVVAFLRDMAQPFEALAGSKGVRYRVDLPEESRVVAFDRDKLEKIVTNLLSNAIKFTQSGGTVAIQATVDPSGGLRIVVSDTGRGIPAALQDRIFGRFYQIDASPTRDFEGSGLGLALTKELVELCGGTIRVESGAGSGSTFTVELPVPTDASAHPMEPGGAWVHHPPVNGTNPVEDAAEPDFTNEESPETSPDGKPTVLLVEDHAELRDYLRQQLADRYHVVGAAQGEDGLRVARATVPDVVISDVMMPVMDGMTLTRRLKDDERTSHIPVILLTAKDDVESRTEGFEGGAEQYLAKPFATEELLARIQSLLTQRSRLQKKYSREVLLQPSAAPIRDREAEFLEKVIAVIDAHLADEAFTVELLQQEIGMSRMQLHRKLKALTDQSASDFIRYIRLQRAADLLRQPGTPVAEAAYASGFGHLSYFSKCFKEQFGVLPSEFAKQREVE
jgi:signal transduction histidine kinase/DNA-binding response OmpR family regulator